MRYFLALLACCALSTPCAAWEAPYRAHKPASRDAQATSTSVARPTSACAPRSDEFSGDRVRPTARAIHANVHVSSQLECAATAASARTDLASQKESPTASTPHFEHDSQSMLRAEPDLPGQPHGLITHLTHTGKTELIVNHRATLVVKF